MTVYCDNSGCAYNEDGFCNNEKLNIIGLECQSVNGIGPTLICSDCKYYDSTGLCLINIERSDLDNGICNDFEQLSQ